jgi:hypothetical protein
MVVFDCFSIYFSQVRSHLVVKLSSTDTRRVFSSHIVTCIVARCLHVRKYTPAAVAAAKEGDYCYLMCHIGIGTFVHIIPYST